MTFSIYTSIPKHVEILICLLSCRVMVLNVAYISSAFRCCGCGSCDGRYSVWSMGENVLCTMKWAFTTYIHIILSFSVFHVLKFIISQIFLFKFSIFNIFLRFFFMFSRVFSFLFCCWSFFGVLSSAFKCDHKKENLIWILLRYNIFRFIHGTHFIPEKNEK